MPKKRDSRYDWQYVGDVDMLGYGGKFYRRLRGHNDLRFHFVEVTNMDEACGRDNEGRPRYVVELSAIHLDELPERTIQDAMRGCGLEDEVLDSIAEQVNREAAIAEACHSYGTKAPLWSGEGNNGHALIREAKRESRELGSDEDALEDRLSQSVNRIGSSAREYMKGDLDAAMLRGIAAGNQEANLLGRMHAPPVGPIAVQVKLQSPTGQGGVPSDDPLAYFMGFMAGLQAELLPSKKGERKKLASAYLEGHAHGTKVRLGKEPVPEWVKPAR